MGLGLLLLILPQHRVYLIEGQLNVISSLRAGQHYLAACENEKHDLGLDHPVDEAWEELWLVGAVSGMARVQTLERDGEPHVTGADDVLNLEFLHFDLIVAHFLDHLSVHACGSLGLFLTLRSSDDHLPRREDECRGLGVTNSNDDCSKSLRVVLSIAAVERNLPQVELDAQVCRRHDVLQLRHRLVLRRPRWGRGFNCD